ALALRDLGNRGRAERTLIAIACQYVDHGGALVERGLQLGLIADHDQLYAEHPYRVVVDLVRVRRHDDFALEPGQIRQPLHALRVATGDGGRGAVRDRGTASGSDDAPLRAGQLGEAFADALHQLVHIDEPTRGFVHSLLHFR